MQTKEQAFEKLARSKFRMRFHLGEQDLQYIDEKGMDVIRSHAPAAVEAVWKMVSCAAGSRTDGRPAEADRGFPDGVDREGERKIVWNEYQ